MLDPNDATSAIQFFAFYLLLAPFVYLAPWRCRGLQLALGLHVIQRSWIVWRTLEEAERWKRGEPTHLLRDWLTDANGILIEFWVPVLLQAVIGGALIAIARKEGTCIIEWCRAWPWLIPDAILLASLAYLAFVIERMQP